MIAKDTDRIGLVAEALTHNWVVVALALVCAIAFHYALPLVLSL